MPNSHKDEYDETITAFCELLWGKGFLAPGGEGNVHKIIEGLDLEGKQVLEIGSGLGGGALVLAEQYGANVTGLEVESVLVDKATEYAAEANLESRVNFKCVKPGLLDALDETIDVVYTSGVIIHIEDKQAIFEDVLRVLKPSGVLAGYDWLKGPGALSDSMLHWIKLEELTFYMDTLENYASIIQQAGFKDVRTTDASAWYKSAARREYEQLTGSLYEQLTDLTGEENRKHFLEGQVAILRVLESGELRSGYFQGIKPGI